MIILGVNVDHIATIREARKTFEPDPVEAAFIAEKAGAKCITVHLREDRRHIKERDLYILRKTVQTKLNLEMALNKEIINIALDVKPDQITLVPEKRKELTTEGGLNVVKNKNNIKKAIENFHKAGIKVSLFINPDEKQIIASKECNADAIELHTGEYANSKTEEKQKKEIYKLIKAAEEGIKLGLQINAGHGLTYYNIENIFSIPQLKELHIGHSIISRAAIYGMEKAVKDMVAIINKHNQK